MHQAQNKGNFICVRCKSYFFLILFNSKFTVIEYVISICHHTKILRTPQLPKIELYTQKIQDKKYFINNCDLYSCAANNTIINKFWIIILLILSCNAYSNGQNRLQQLRFLALAFNFGIYLYEVWFADDDM